MALECQKQAPKADESHLATRRMWLGLLRANGQRATPERPIRVNIEPITSICSNTTARVSQVNPTLSLPLSHSKGHCLEPRSLLIPYVQLKRQRSPD